MFAPFQPPPYTIDFAFKMHCPTAYMDPADFAQHYEGQVILNDNIEKKQKNIGTVSVFVVEVQQAVRSPFQLRGVFESRHRPLHGMFEDIFSTDPADEGSFRPDLLIEPCNKILLIDILKIRKQHREFSLVAHCIESLIRLFACLDVTIADMNNLDLSEAEWAHLQFFKISGTPYCARDNSVVLQEELLAQGGGYE